MGENKISEFVKTNLIKLQKSDNIFGNGSIESIDFNDSKDKALHFLSEVAFATVRVQNSDGVQKKFPVVVKVRVKNEFFAETESLTLDVFVNESAMYRDLLPELNDASKLSLTPKCYYSQSVEKDDLEPIIVLEDLRSKGYKVVKDQLFLDDRHMKLALEKLGQFHGLGYRYKQKHDDLSEKCRELKKLKFATAWTDAMKGFLSYYLNRYINRLIKENKHKEIMMKFKEKISDVNTFLDSLTTPQEPFATIIHGDLNKNNMIFLYDSQNQPIDVKFFDLQNSLYNDPALDLGFFLYMNTDQSARDRHWDEFMAAYWNGLTSVVPQPEFTFEEFLENFASKAIIGYVEPSFYIPTCIEPEKSLGIQMDHSSSAEDKLANLEALGGEQAYDIVIDVLTDIIDRGYLEKYLSFS